MASAPGVTLIIFRFVNAIIHTLGCYLLIRQYKDGKDTPQQVYLINLALAESTQNFFSAFMSPFFCKMDLLKNAVYAIDKFQETFVIITVVSVNLVYYMSMIFITFDRLLEILLNIKYPLYWNVCKSKYLILSTWLTSAVVCIICLVSYTIDGFDYYPYVWYVYLSADFIFVFTALITYIFIFRKYRQTRVHPSRNISNQRGIFHVFRKSRFYISVLLITSFLCFKVTADFLFFFARVIVHEEEGDVGHLGMLVFHLWAMNDFVDAWIYIFLQKSVRVTLWRKCQICRETTEHIQPNVIIRRWTISTVQTTSC